MIYQDIILQLFEIEAVRFGEFQLKSGALSPIYVDLRRIFSYPKLLKKITEALIQKLPSLTFDTLCGVPYTAVPLATALSLSQEIPMLLCRKESKNHGLKKMIEGALTVGETCLIVEDVASSGSSILETKAHLQTAGLKITDALVIVDRQMGGKENLKAEGIELHSLFSLKTLLITLLKENKIRSNPSLEELL